MSDDPEWASSVASIVALDESEREADEDMGADLREKKKRGRKWSSLREMKARQKRLKAAQ